MDYNNLHVFALYFSNLSRKFESDRKVEEETSPVVKFY